MNNKIIDNAINYVKELFINNSDGHDFDHTLRVYQTSIELAKNYKEADSFIISLASLLHDVDDHKLFDHTNNENAISFLKSQEVDQDTINKIINIINSVSFSKNKGNKPETIEAQIVQDADRLDAIGAIGVVRAFAYGNKHNRSLEDTINHFHEKLLLLKDMMNTKEAKELAKERHEFLLKFLEELERETKHV